MLPGGLLSIKWGLVAMAARGMPLARPAHPRNNHGESAAHSTQPTAHNTQPTTHAALFDAKLGMRHITRKPHAQNVQAHPLRQGTLGAKGPVFRVREQRCGASGSASQSAPFAIMRMSGTTPHCVTVNQSPVRPKPLWISSAIRRMLCLSQKARKSLKKPAGGTTYPPSPAPTHPDAPPRSATHPHTHRANTHLNPPHEGTPATATAVTGTATRLRGRPARSAS
jgi:hypothetical protein